MLRTFSAQEYMKAADRGINRPLLIRAEGDAGAESVYLKTSAGYGDRPYAPGVELFCTLRARELRVVAPVHRELARESVGLNFGTIALGSDWKTWPVEMSTNAFPHEVIERILAFDALVQHTDRHPDNPNMQWRGREIAVLDHEKCFGHLHQDFRLSSKPWRPFLESNPFHFHCLRAAGKRLQSETTGRDMWVDLIGLEMSGRVEEIAAEVVEHFPLASEKIGKIHEYFQILFRDISDFIDYFRYSLSR
jgi:hypothetical protein